ncbi:unnamed protein product [Albugo candida]|uniref:Uncharacterized protein n=1 Tax=Albugo candida TaxID=65357 RepID=A0A024G8N3_9STRA|nr:unnamed protein product [Albugo candida]|eukprot:CCI43118.1 unnamed protein product [Albugo candida]
MKAFSSKTYAALVLGVLQARHHFVAATLDLTVNIRPEIRLENDNLVLHSIDLMEKYTVLIDSGHISRRTAKVTSEEEFKRGGKGSVNSMTGSASHKTGKMRNDFNGDLSRSLLENSSTADQLLAHNLEDKSSIWHVDTIVTENLNTVLHTTGWKLLGSLLIEWFKIKLLYAFENRVFMERKAYVKRHDGVYSHAWTAEKGYVFEIGLPEPIHPGSAREDDQFLRVTVDRGSSEQFPAKMRVDLDTETVSIPPPLYRSCQRDLNILHFWVAKDGNGNAVFQGAYSSINDLAIMHPCELPKMAITVRIPDAGSFRINLSAYTVYDEGICTFLIMQSKDDALVLGAPILESCSVIIRNTNRELAYQFLCRD